MEEKHPGLQLLWGKLTELMDAWRSRFLHWVTSGKVQHDWAGEAHGKSHNEEITSTGSPVPATGGPGPDTPL